MLNRRFCSRNVETNTNDLKDFSKQDSSWSGIDCVLTVVGR